MAGSCYFSFLQTGIRLLAAFLFFSCQPESKIRPHLPEFLVFAGDTIPLEEPEIRERLERELLINQYWHSNTIQWLRKSQRWFPVMDSILDASGVPADFRYLVPIESGFENVISPKGATGFWQLMEGTATEFGLIVSPEIDERLDPEKATVAACKLIMRGYRQFKSWPETAVSYNIGITGLRSVMQAQYSDSYFDLLINQESGRYLFRILAAKLIMENPAQYGFEIPEAIPPYKWKNQLLTDSIPDLPWWCRKQGFSYKCFRLLNPWIKTSYLHLPPGRSILQVKIPLDCKLFTGIGLPDLPAADSLARQYRITEENLVGKKDITAFRSSGKDSARMKKVHLVRRGEAASNIARQYGLSLSALLSLNPDLSGNPKNLQEGMSLKVSP